MKINKVAVIGAGVMGGGIAAQVANAGLPVVLLDIKLEGRDLAREAVAKMLKIEPAAFMHKSNAKLITCGNLEDDLDKLGDVDWIIEVVIENLEIKHKTYETLQKHRKKGSIISSNTSTIPLYKLAENQSQEFKNDFMITHFFNPPRYMRLLELVTSKDTRQDAIDTVRDFCDKNMGKGVVVCNDTPGFIANRLGVFWLTAGVNTAIKQGISIEVADAVMGKPCGIPNTGIFGLIDLVGIDLMPKLSESLLTNLLQDDAYRDVFIDHKFVHNMIDEGYTGRKGKGGFYRLNPDAPKGVREKQALDIVSLHNANTGEGSNEELASHSSSSPNKTLSSRASAEGSKISPPLSGVRDDTSGDSDVLRSVSTPIDAHYVKSQKKAAQAMASVKAGSTGLKAVVTCDDEGGKYAWEVLKHTLFYAAELVGEVAGTIHDIDEAMKLGYNWKFGPFEMIDALGAKWFADKLLDDDIGVPEILDQVANDTFYRIENGVRQYFGTDGAYHDVQRPDGVLLLRDIKLTSQPVIKNASAKVWDIGDGVLCFEHCSKMNTFDEQIFDLLEEVNKLISKSEEYNALVIYNEGSHFSAGANLGLAIFMINIAMWAQVENFISRGQQVFMDLKFAPFPMVSAPSGMALGGGCEILLASDAVQAHCETYCGLVEVGVGLLPGWGGCKEMILRFQERERAKFKADLAKVDKDHLWFSPDTTPVGAVRKAFEVIGMASVAKSAFEAKTIGYFRDSDGISMNRDRLLYDAKQRAMELAKDYVVPEKVDNIRLGGAGAKMALELAVSDLRKSGKATPYDVVVSDHLATVLSGGSADYTETLSEDDMLKLELTEFMKLLHNDGTLERIEHMLSTGKPLRN